MDVMHERVAGIDIHQKKLAVCILTGDFSSAKPLKEHITCGTTTSELKVLGDWLLEKEISHVFMESTSQYWCPVWNVLEEMGFSLILANPRRIKGIPGRKTDQNDAEWIAELGRMGLIPASYMPKKAIQDFRRLTRTRSRLIKQRTQHRNRIHNVLQQANIKLTSYLSNVFGVTGKKLLQKLIDGEVITLEVVENVLKETRHGKGVNASAEELLASLDDTFSKIHLEELDVHFHIIETLESEIMRLEKSIEEYTSMYQETY